MRLSLERWEDLRDERFQVQSGKSRSADSSSWIRHKSNRGKYPMKIPKTDVVSIYNKYIYTTFL
jgi:hypothetical protein